MSDSLLTTTEFTMEDQRAFARLSGDWNPLHTDPIAARREMLGAVVVHGVHAFLRLLDAFAERGGLTDRRIASCNVRFKNALELDREFALEVVGDSPEKSRLRVARDGKALIDVRIGWSSTAAEAESRSSGEIAAGNLHEPAEPRLLAFEELADRRGSLLLSLDAAAFARLFPSLGPLPAAQCAEFLALTRLVGMECPGLRSIFSGFEVQAAESPAAGSPPALAYHVTSADPRFSMIKLSVEGPTLRGTVDALYRPAPAVQPSMQSASAAVNPAEFEDQRALIVGGSRGLGEVVAKIVAAGGGHSVVTYHRGKSDAEGVVSEIRAGGGRADCLAWSIDEPESSAAGLRVLAFQPTHLYYFASPKIFVKKPGLFEPSLYDEFARFYVSAFFEAYRACRAASDGHLALVYPSSVALDEPVRELVEYAAAKAAGESLCEHLARFEKRVSVVVRRLPRIETDQTATLVEVPAADALVEMLRLVREAQRSVPVA